MSDFHRYAPAMAVFFGAALVMASIFGSVVIWGGSPVSPELFGPIVYAFPAIVWAGLQVAFSAIAMIGAGFNWPRITTVGAFLLGCKFLFFATAAIAAGATGTLLIAMAIPATGICWLAALIAYRGRDGAGR